MSQSTRSKGVRSSTPIRSAASQSNESPPDSLLYSRLEEKKNLQYLNDKLATYIGQVRSLQTENATLIKRFQTCEETASREVTAVKSLYENEIAENREQIAAALKSKASLQLDLQRVNAENDELSAKATQLDKELQKFRTRTDQIENENRKLKTDLAEYIDRFKKLEGERNEIAKELADLKKQHTAIQGQLQKETVARIDLETKLKSLEEKLAFEEHVHREELNQSRTSRSEIEEQVTRDTEAYYSQKLGDELTQLRNESDEKLRLSRAELEHQYESQIRDLQAKIKTRVANENKLRSELQAIQSTLSRTESSLKEQQSANNGLKERNADLEKILDQERSSHVLALKEKDNELAELTQNHQDYLKQYKDLYDVKVALDLEIDTYRRLVEGEELRYNTSLDDLSVSSGSLSAMLSPRLAKRKRRISEEEHYSTEYLTDSQLNGDVEVVEHDPEGKCVKIENKGEKDISLSGWQVIRKAGEETITYKFHRNVVLKVNSAITIWSQNAESATHNPPSDLMMKQQTWPAAAEMSTVLLDNTGKEVAVRTTKLKTNKRRVTSHLNGSSDGEKTCNIQ